MRKHMNSGAKVLGLQTINREDILGHMKSYLISLGILEIH